MTPTQRSLKWLRDVGFAVEVVERWNPHAKVRHDLFGCFDLLAINPIRGIVGVQVTSGSNVAARVAKLQQTPELRAWLLAGGRAVVQGWRKAGARGKRKTWQLREVWL